ncbi:MAG: hypothetical protein QOE31_4012 [Solirubrobacteraceae bacterium]|nr:hypothetical protein [Solirubrobacteraceae bacterium]
MTRRATFVTRGRDRQGIVDPVAVFVGVRRVVVGVLRVVVGVLVVGVVGVVVGVLSVVLGVLSVDVGVCVAGGTATAGPVGPDGPLGPLGPAVVIAAGVVEAGALPSSVSLTNANASIAPATRMIAPIATVGSCQFGVCARRVRAGAPHSRHQS